MEIHEIFSLSALILCKNVLLDTQLVFYTANQSFINCNSQGSLVCKVAKVTVL